MNIKMGLKRTAIVLAIFWVVGWSFVAWQGNKEVDYAMEEIAELKRQYPEGHGNPDYTDMQIYWMQLANRGSDKVGYAVTIGLFVPVVLLILSPFGWFIYRGFKPKMPPDST